MKFSIIIPCYKVEKYLSECVDSVLNQSFTDYELILIDDGSPDRVPEMCDEYAKKNARVRVIHQKNSGQASARNHGLKIAKGEYILYLDSDDYWSDSNMLQKLVAKCDGKVDIVFYGYMKYYESDKSFGNPIVNYPAGLKKMSQAAAIQALLDADMFDGSAWNKAILRSVLQDNGVEFVTGIISEDSDWYMQVTLIAKTYDAINESFVVYRLRGGSTSHSSNIKALKDNLWILEKWTKAIEKSPFREQLLAVLARYYANAVIIYSIYDKSQVIEYYVRLKKLSFLLKYSKTTRSKIIKYSMAIFGLKQTSRLIRIVSKYKRRI